MCKISKIIQLGIFIFVVMGAGATKAASYTRSLNEFIKLELKPWSASDIVIDSLNISNEKNEGLIEVNLMNLNDNWRSELRKLNQPLIRAVINSELSQFLKKKVLLSQGVFTEITVIDLKGLNIAQTTVSKDYWNFGKPRWDKTFGQNSYATYISDIYYSDATGKFQVEIGFIVSYDDQPMGVMVAGIDVEQLEDWEKRRRK